LLFAAAVQEYCDCGTLASVASEWKLEPESDQKMLERLQLLRDCAQGLKELHSRNVVHGDLNARNVLLSSSGVTALGVVAKLADLGLSRIVRSHRSHHSTNTVGTMSHVAPGGSEEVAGCRGWWVE
jgi:serine/threonine protein kinase